MTDDLVKRLREFEISDDLGNGDFSTCEEAADRIEELKRHVELRDFFLIENGLWERFAKGVQVKTND